MLNSTKRRKKKKHSKLKGRKSEQFPSVSKYFKLSEKSFPRFFFFPPLKTCPHSDYLQNYTRASVAFFRAFKNKISRFELLFSSSLHSEVVFFFFFKFWLFFKSKFSQDLSETTFKM